jgi:hypothetical protein
MKIYKIDIKRERKKKKKTGVPRRLKALTLLYNLS